MSLLVQQNQRTSAQVQPATPFLRIDAKRVRANIDRLAEYCAEHGLALWPHAKTHKSQLFARWQLDAGAAGLTVAKVSEAEVMAEVCDRLLIAYPLITPDACRRAARIARTASVTVATDSQYSLEQLDAAAAVAEVVLDILVDVNIGLGRTGVQGPQQALHLARQAASRSHLRFAGIFCYPGHIGMRSDQQHHSLAAVQELIAGVKRELIGAGMTIDMVSSGSTPTAYQSHRTRDVTAIRPGTYIFNDMNTVHGGFCSLDDCAVTIECMVISTAVKGQVVVDAGSKTLSPDVCVPAPHMGHGHVIGYPGARVTRMSEEHSQIDVRGCGRPPELGNRLRIIPNHVCPCVNLHDRACLFDRDRYEWTKIDARGMVS